MKTTSRAMNYGVTFAYRNTYGTERSAATFVVATSERLAVEAARARLLDLYGIKGARLLRVVEDGRA